MDLWRTDILPGYRTKVIQRGSATIYVHRPMLSADDQSRREQHATEALAAGMKDFIRRKDDCNV